MKFTIFQESRPGRRPANEDRIAYSYSRDALLMVVADGMGGHLHGEVAAQIAVRHLIETFERESMPRLPDPFLFLSWGLTNAHQAIAAYAGRPAAGETGRLGTAYQAPLQGQRGHLAPVLQVDGCGRIMPEHDVQDDPVIGGVLVVPVRPPAAGPDVDLHIPFKKPPAGGDDRVP